MSFSLQAILKSALVSLLAIGFLSACLEEEEKKRKFNSNVQDCRRNLPPLQPLENKPQNLRAEVTLTFKDFVMSVENGYYNYDHSRLFHELSGVGGYFYRGRVCLNDGQNCVDACLTNRLNAGESIQQNNHRFTSKSPRDRIVTEYWFRDDYGYLSYIGYNIYTDGNDIKFELFEK